MLPDDVGRMKPLVGISCCTKLFGMFGMPNHAATDTYVQATHSVVGAVPVLLPANGDACDLRTLLARLDGIILTGSRSNVQPSLYGGPAPEEARGQIEESRARLARDDAEVAAAQRHLEEARAKLEAAVDAVLASA